MSATAVAAMLMLAGAAQAQDAPRPPGGLLGGLFGGGDSSGGDRGQGMQRTESDLVVRIDRLENQIRQLTGTVEQLQYRNQQLEQMLARSQGGDAGGRYQQGGRPTASSPMPNAGPSYPSREPAMSSPPRSSPERRSDVFDPSQHPNAPGAPRPLGGGLTIAGPEPNAPSVGAPGGREAGAPLDLSTLGAPAGNPGESDQSGAVPGGNLASLPPPPPRNTSATGAASATQPPTRSSKDEYDLAYGYLLRKDYALAENAFKTFLRDHPDDRMAADATYWLGESMYQRQRYRDAAESFLAVTTKHDKSAKAADALYRLGQSLAAMGEKEAACAALGEIGRKYPRASAGVKQGVSREQKRVQC